MWEGDDVGFFKRLLRGKDKKTDEPMRGMGRLQTDEEQDAVRKKMEGEMTNAREKRDAAPTQE